IRLALLPAVLIARGEGVALSRVPVQTAAVILIGVRGRQSGGKAMIAGIGIVGRHLRETVHDALQEVEVLLRVVVIGGIDAEAASADLQFLAREEDPAGESVVPD